VLVEIYERAGVTSYPREHLPNYHEAARKVLMSGHGLIGTSYFTKSPNYRTFCRQAERVSEVEKGKNLPAVLEGCIPCPNVPVLLPIVVLTYISDATHGKAQPERRFDDLQQPSCQVDEPSDQDARAPKRNHDEHHQPTSQSPGEG
jgi:hypothetical protein